MAYAYSPLGASAAEPPSDSKREPIAPSTHPARLLADVRSPKRWIACCCAGAAFVTALLLVRRRAACAL